MLKNVILLFLLSIVSTSASNKVPEQYKFSSVFEYPDSIVLKREAVSTSIAIKFPAVPKQADKILCLRFKAFLKTKSNSGWNNFLKINLNKHLLSTNTDNDKFRLLRRGTFMHNTLPEPANYRLWWDDGKLLIFFNNGEGAVDNQVISPRDEGVDYLLDISDYVNYVEIGPDNRVESAKQNILELTNLFNTRIAKGRYQNVNMHIEKLEIGYVSKAQAELMRPKKEGITTKVEYSQVAAKVANNIFQVMVHAGGGMSISCANQTFAQIDKFSYPAEPYMLFNELTPGTVKGQSEWKPVVSQQDNVITIKSKALQYFLLRTIIVKENHILVSDKFTNTSNVPIGISLDMYTVSPTELRDEDFYLAGRPGLFFTAGIASNPTVFMRSKSGSLGVFAEDNILRNHISLKHKGNSIVMSDKHLGLAPGASHTLVRTFWPAVNGSYWDFINKIRQLNNLNIKLIGPFCFGLPTPRMKSIISVLDPWFEYYKGIDYSRQQYKTMMQKQIADIREKGEIKFILPKTESNLITINKLELKGGEILPNRTRLNGGKYGELLSAEQTDLFKTSKYWDSMLFSKDNKAYVDTFYVLKPNIQLLVQPEIGNYRYKNMLEQTNFLIEDVGFDGIYFDQFAPGNGGPLGRRDRCTYNKWDGITVDLDDKGQIIRKYYDYAIAGAKARAAILNNVIDKGKLAIANTQAVVNETLKIPAMRFHEMENDPQTPSILLGTAKPPVMRFQALCHLSNSPIILGIRQHNYSKNRKDWAKILNRAVIIGLRNGVLYYHYGKEIAANGAFGPVDNMFPMTPIEIGEGFMIGKERVISCVSRKFMVKGEKPQVLLFDELGKPKECPFNATKTMDGWEIDVKLKDWNEIAVIIK